MAASTPTQPAVSHRRACPTNDFADCPPGQASSQGAQQACQSCTAGLSYTDGPGKTSCELVRICQPGEFVTAAPTSTSNRGCQFCGVGTVSNTFNAVICSPCPAGESQPAEGQTSCVNPGCPVGTRSFGTICFACSPGTFQNETGQDFCHTVSTCPPGWHIAVSSTATTDVVCQPCPAGSYSNQPNAEVCANCEGDVEFQDLPGQTSCVAQPMCSPGEKVEQVATPFAKRTCTQCPAGHFSAKTNALSCLKCPAGSFSTVGSDACRAFTECGPEQLAVVAPTAARDRVCEDIVHCKRGEVVAVQLNLTGGINRQCSLCPRGTMSNTTDANTCTACTASISYQPASGQQECFSATVCPPGEYVTVQPTAFSNRQCGSCPQGFVSGTYNAGACIACDGVLGYSSGSKGTSCMNATVCNAGEHILVDATPSSDRSCRSCPPGTVSSAENQPECLDCDGVTGYAPESKGTSCITMNPPCALDEVEVRIPCKPYRWLHQLKSMPSQGRSQS